MDPITDISSGIVQKSAHDDDCSDHSIESTPLRSQFVANPRSNCNNSCKEAHPDVGGRRLRDVLSITIQPSTKFEASTVKIYGAIRVEDYVSRELYYVLRRKKEDALEVDVSSPGQNITLPLDDPSHLAFFNDNIPSLTFVFMLMFDDETIFNEDHFKPLLMEPSFPFVAENMKNVGCGSYLLARHVSTYYPLVGDMRLITLPLPAESLGNIVSKKVHSVDVNMVFMLSGRVAYLRFKTFKIAGSFFGKITARPCLRPEDESIVLFEKKEEEAVFVLADHVIPLSRSLVAVCCGSSLVIDVQLHDRRLSDSVLHGTIHFHVGDNSPNTWLRGIYSSQIQLFIGWTENLYQAREILEMDMALATMKV